jgi:transcriptional regulator with XRE-family HTH domain
MEERELWHVDGEAIIAWRRRRGWNRRMLARAARLSPHTVARMERGATVFPQSVAAIAEIMALPIERLRSHAGPLGRLQGSERKLGEIALNQLELYYHVEAERNAELLRTDFSGPLHPDVVLTASSVIPLPFSGVYRGIPGVIEFLESGFDSVLRTERAEVEKVSCIDSRRVAVSFRDTIHIPRLGARLVGSGALYFTVGDANLDPRIVSINIVADSVTLVPDTPPNGEQNGVSPSFHR